MTLSGIYGGENIILYQTFQ